MSVNFRQKAFCWNFFNFEKLKESERERERHTSRYLGKLSRSGEKNCKLKIIALKNKYIRLEEQMTLSFELNLLRFNQFRSSMISIGRSVDTSMEGGIQIHIRHSNPLTRQSKAFNCPVITWPLLAFIRPVDQRLSWL